METLLLIVGLSVFLLLIMWGSRPKDSDAEHSGRRPSPERVQWLDPAVQGTFDRAAQRPGAPCAAEAHWEGKVLSQLRGDRAAMERLVAYQARRVPRASRRELLERVYDDHVRDLG